MVTSPASRTPARTDLEARTKAVGPRSRDVRQTSQLTRPQPAPAPAAIEKPPEPPSWAYAGAATTMIAAAVMNDAKGRDIWASQKEVAGEDRRRCRARSMRFGKPRNQQRKALSATCFGRAVTECSYAGWVREPRKIRTKTRITAAFLVHAQRAAGRCGSRNVPHLQVRWISPAQASTHSTGRSHFCARDWITRRRGK